MRHAPYAVSRSARRVSVLLTAIAAASSTFLTVGGCARKPAASAPAEKPDQLYARGAKAYQTGDRTAAIPSLEAAVQANPNLIMARERLGDAYKDLGRYDDATAQYQVLTQLDPYGPTSWYKLGVSQQMFGKLDAASESYRHALRLDGREWRSRMNLGLVELAKGNTEGAVEATKQAADAAPKEPDAWSNYGVTLDNAGRLADAESAYRKSLALNASQPAVQMNLATNLIAQKKPGEAVEPLQAVVRDEDSAMARKRLGDALAASDQPGEADSQYRVALQRDPSYYAALNALAALKMSQFEKSQDASKKSEAVDAWQQSLKLNPNQPAIKSALEAAR